MKLELQGCLAADMGGITNANMQIATPREVILRNPAGI
jgi:hypothetical protein